MYKVVLSWLGTVQLTNKRFKCLRNILLSFVTVSIEMEIRCARFFVPPQIAHFPAFLTLKKPCTFPKTGRRKNYQNSFCAKMSNSVQKFVEYASTFAQNYSFFRRIAHFFVAKVCFRTKL